MGAAVRWMAERLHMDLEQALTELERRMDHSARPWMDVRALGGVPVLQAKLPGLFRACFTTRIGGSSSGPFAEANMDARSADNPDARVQQSRPPVERNRLQVGEPLASSRCPRSGVV